MHLKQQKSADIRTTNKYGTSDTRSRHAIRCNKIKGLIYRVSGVCLFQSCVQLKYV